MRVQRRHRLAALLTALVFAFSPNPSQGANGSHAEATCPNGTSWDNLTQTCK